MLPIPSFDTLDDYVARKLVSRVDLDNLSICNYTEATTYTHAWDDVTCVCRGLILNRETGEVVARAFDKFFNYGEQGVNQQIPDTLPDTVTIKHDGSLGIGFRHRGRFLWSTRGSFYSIQAAIAQRIWDDHYTHVDVPYNLTPLVEIIAPGTRNVVNYGDREDLILLAVRDRFTGEDLPFERVQALGALWSMSVTRQVGGDLASIIAQAATLDHQHEGFVVRWGDFRLKVKSLEYMAVARLIMGLSPRRIADIWYAKRLDLLEPLPEEHRDYALDQMLVLDRKVDTARAELAAMIESVGAGHDRKSFVAAVGTSNPMFKMAIDHFTGREVDYAAHVYRVEFDGRPRPVDVEVSDA